MQDGASLLAPAADLAHLLLPFQRLVQTLRKAFAEVCCVLFVATFISSSHLSAQILTQSPFEIVSPTGKKGSRSHMLISVDGDGRGGGDRLQAVVV